MGVTGSMPSRTPWLAVVLCSSIACAQAPEAPPEAIVVAADCPATIAPAAPTVAAIGSQDRLVCPKDTTRSGSPPPDGVEQWCERNDGARHGPVATYFPLGGVRGQGMMHEGQKDGLWQEYFADGSLREESEYRRGVPIGRWSTWTDDGAIVREAIYTSDRERRVTEFRRDGSRMREGVEIDGLAHGEWREWNHDGRARIVKYDGGGEAHGSFAKVGIAECDEYIRKYARCIEDHVPEAARGPMKAALDASVEAWREAAAGPAADGLATACRAALDAAEHATRSMGCEW